MTKNKVPQSVQEWSWNPDWMKDEELKEQYRNDPIETATLLYNIGWTLVPLYETLLEGNFVMFSAMCTVKEMWDATNFARLWSEKNHPEIDHTLQDALSEICDAFYMIESLWEWDQFSKQGILSIVNSLKLGLNSIRQAINELDYYIYYLYHDEGEEDGNEKGGVE